MRPVVMVIASSRVFLERSSGHCDKNDPRTTYGLDLQPPSWVRLSPHRHEFTSSITQLRTDFTSLPPPKVAHRLSITSDGQETTGNSITREGLYGVNQNSGCFPSSHPHA